MHTISLLNSSDSIGKYGPLISGETRIRDINLGKNNQGRTLDVGLVSNSQAVCPVSEALVSFLD